MIRYALACARCDSAFEAWFASSAAFDEQAARGDVHCPACGSPQVGKQVMSPAVASGRQRPGRDGAAAAARDFISRTHDYVGEHFAGEAIAMHHGEIDARPIWGETTPDQREALRQEGVAAFPIPAPCVPAKPDAARKLN